MRQLIGNEHGSEKAGKCGKETSLSSSSDTDRGQKRQAGNEKAECKKEKAGRQSSSNQGAKMIKLI